MVFGCTPVEGCIAALDENKPALEASVLVVLKPTKTPKP